MNIRQAENCEPECVTSKTGSRRCSVKARRRCMNWAYKIAITAGLLFLLSALGYAMQVYKSITIGALFYLAVMLNAGWFFYLLAPVVRIRLFNALLFMGLFVWGCMLYFCSPVREGDYSQSLVERQIEAPNRAVAAFFPSRGGFEAIAKFNDRQQRIHYFAFHTVVLFYVALLMFSIFGRGIVNRVRKWLVPWRRLNVFWGRSDVGLLLARNITETTVRGQVFFMLQQRSGDGDEWLTLTHDIDRMDAMWSFTYDSNAVETDVSKDTLGQAKGLRHFFMDESGHVNVSRADRLVTVLRNWAKMRKERGKLRCFFAAARAGVLRWWLTGCKKKPYFYVRVEASVDELTFQRWAAGVRDVVTPILVRESQLIARDFIKKYPLLKMPGIKIDTTNAVVKEGEFKLLILGFGAVGQDILNEFVCNGQFLNAEWTRTPFSVDVVEQDKDVVEEYKLRHPLVCDTYNVNFIEGVRVEDESFDNWFKAEMGSYNRIVVCLKGDDKTLAIANKVVEFARRHNMHIKPNVVYARVTDPARNRYVKMYSIFERQEPPEHEQMITLFGNLADIYSFDRLDAEVVDTMAKVLNSRYNRDGQGFYRDLADEDKRESAWENASFFDQLSSRAAAEGQRNLLLLRGLDYRANVERVDRIVLPEEVDAPLTDESFRQEHSVLKTLSINEHLRWNAFHLMMGFRPWHVIGREDVARNDIPQPWPKKIRANQLATIGKHADIVDFEKLPDVDMVLKAWKEGKTKEELGLDRKNFEGLTEGSSQAWDIAFCQIIGKVAKVAGQEIVKPKPRDNA